MLRLDKTHRISRCPDYCDSKQSKKKHNSDRQRFLLAGTSDFISVSFFSLWLKKTGSMEKESYWPNFHQSQGINVDFGLPQLPYVCICTQSHTHTHSLESGQKNNTHKLFIWASSLVAQMVKNLPVMQESWVRSLGWGDSLEKGMATHSSILAWRIQCTEELYRGLLVLTRIRTILFFY